MKVKSLFNSIDDINIFSYLSKKGVKDVEAFLNPKDTNEESSNLYENMYESFHALMSVVDDIKKGQ